MVNTNKNHHKPSTVKQKLLQLLILLTLAVTAKAGLNTRYTPERPLRFGVSADYPPMESIGPDGKPLGYDVEFTRLLVLRLGLPLEYHGLPWKDIPRATITGDIDLSLMTFSTYRQDSVYYSRAVFKLYYQMVYRNDLDDGHVNMRNLKGKRVAYLSSKPVTDTLTMAGAVPYVVQSLPEAVLDLSTGKYDAVICYRYQAKALIKGYRLSNLSSEDITLMPREYCYASTDPRLIERINVELDKMDREGVIRSVYEEAGIFFESVKIPLWVWALLAFTTILFLVWIILLQRRYQHRLKAEVDRALRSEQAKVVFLGNVSHVFRTPLNAINGFSYVLLSDTSGELPLEERTELARLVHENGERLLHFTNEILDLTEIESSELKFERKEIDLDKAMNDCADQVRAGLAEGVSLHVVPDPKGPRRLYIDERLMQTTTRHLLDNAVRHTKTGQIILAYRIDGTNLYVEVRDTGCGVPEELRQNIFALSAEKAVTVQSDVPGLGLTICRAIVERCNGQIGLVSPAEGGACFWTSVPVKVVK